MRRTLAGLCALAAGVVLASGVTAADLKRAGQFGVVSGPVTAELTAKGAPAGAVVQSFAAIPGLHPLTAQALGVQPGDVITAVDDRAVTDVASLLRAMAPVREGDRTTLKVWRDGRALTLTGAAVGISRETYAGATTVYGSVPFRGGALRDIWVAPGADHKGPVVMLIQGYTCGSIESANPDASYRRLAKSLVARGVAFYRVEKPGIGDSAGGASCHTSDYATEVEAFEAAYRHLTTTLGVDRRRLFIFGHSMGGLQAPLIAARNPAPRGIAVYGTVLRNWTEWAYDAVKLQSFYFGTDPVQADANYDAYKPGIDALYAGTLSFEETARDSKLAAGMRAIGWVSGEYLANRHRDFWRQIEQAPLMAGWRDSKSRVLAVYGQSDLVAIDDKDHRLIADVVNYYRPRTARFVAMPNGNHSLQLIEDRDTLLLRNWGKVEGAAPAAQFNEAFPTLLVDWITESMALPPVD